MSASTHLAYNGKHQEKGGRFEMLQSASDILRETVSCFGISESHT